MEARRISQDTDNCSRVVVDVPLRDGVSPVGLVRVCCAVARLVQGLSDGIPRTGPGLSPSLHSCHCCASRSKESLWRSGREAS